ncbi:MAG TPA: Flp family type IVb pilin [Methylocystis sp.]|nr:Flp family type IVb pilin [Methylocystis sp.]
MRKLAKAFWRDECGATAIEYALVASLIAIAAIAAMKSVGSRVKLTFGDVANNLSSY